MNCGLEIDVQVLAGRQHSVSLTKRRNLPERVSVAGDVANFFVLGYSRHYFI